MRDLCSVKAKGLRCWGVEYLSGRHGTFIGKPVPRCPLTEVCEQRCFSVSSKNISLLLRTELDFELQFWLPGSYTPSLCFFFAQTEQVERNYIKEKKAAVKEFEDKKVELKENLIAELEEKKKMIENEKLTMELTGGKKALEGRGLGVRASGLLFLLLLLSSALEQSMVT